MVCRTMPLPGGGYAIVCGPAPKRKRCSACGKPADLLCDWKVDTAKTCDAPICAACAVEPAPDKHLCREHQATWLEWRERRNEV